MHLIHRYRTVAVVNYQLVQKCRVCGKQRVLDLPSPLLHSGNHNTRPTGSVGAKPLPNGGGLRGR